MFLQILVSLPYLHTFSTLFTIVVCYCHFDWTALDAVYPLDYDYGSGQSCIEALIVYVCVYLILFSL